MPTPLEYISFLRQDGAALASAAAKDLQAPVPSCPDWTMADLVRHTGEVHRAKLATVQLGGTTRPAALEYERAPADDGPLLGWYTDGLEQLAGCLAAVDPQQPAWSWAEDHRVAFWQRRMAQETLVHRWDAENAVGAPSPMDTALAADGVDEYLRIFLDDPETPPQGPTGRITIRTTDVDRTWTLDTTSWPPDVVSGAVDSPDATIIGTAEQVLLALWRRRPLDTVEIGGDAAVVRAFHDAADL